MAKGTVQRFDPERGYGCINPDDKREGMVVAHVHFMEAAAPGFPALKEGQRVEYVPVAGKHNTIATKMKVCS